MKIFFQRLKPTVINYRGNRSFENKLFREELLSNATLEENANSFEEFIKICQKNSNLSCPNQPNICTGQPFAIYEQNPFKSNNA